MSSQSQRRARRWRKDHMCHYQGQQWGKGLLANLDNLLATEFFYEMCINPTVESPIKDIPNEGTPRL